MSHLKNVFATVAVFAVANVVVVAAADVWVVADILVVVANVVAVCCRFCQCLGDVANVVVAVYLWSVADVVLVVAAADVWAVVNVFAVGLTQPSYSCRTCNIVVVCELADIVLYCEYHCSYCDALFFHYFKHCFILLLRCCGH